MAVARRQIHEKAPCKQQSVDIMLHIRLLGGRKVVSGDVMGGCDHFVEFKHGSVAAKSAVGKGANPAWNQVRSADGTR